MQHQQCIADRNRQCTARTALAEDHRDVRNAKREACVGRARDGFGLAALFRIGNLDEELAKRDNREAMVPIDRDPVPGRFSELVRKYYENLGKDSGK